MRLAAQYDTSPYCVALNWLLQLGKNLLPIPGASRIESILDSIRADKISLHPEDMLKIQNIHL